MRLFLAALLPQEIIELVSGYTNNLRRDVDGVKWEKPEKLHITLKFLGSVDRDLINDIISMLKIITPQYSPFNLALTGFGAFPNLKNPRVLFAGVSKNVKLASFQKKIDKDLSELGLDSESKKFVPHITVGRVKKRIKILEPPALEQKDFIVSQIGLIKSELRPEGSVYTPVEIFELEK